METFSSHLKHILQAIISKYMTKIKMKTSRQRKQSSLQPTSYKTHFLRASNETMNQKNKCRKGNIYIKHKFNMLTAHLAYSDTCCKSTHNVLSLVSWATYSAKNTKYASICLSFSHYFVFLEESFSQHLCDVRWFLFYFI